jgi:hypothetical protein
VLVVVSFLSDRVVSLEVVSFLFLQRLVDVTGGFLLGGKVLGQGPLQRLYLGAMCLALEEAQRSLSPPSADSLRHIIVMGTGLHYFRTFLCNALKELLEFVITACIVI